MGLLHYNASFNVTFFEPPVKKKDKDFKPFEQPYNFDFKLYFKEGKVKMVIDNIYAAKTQLEMYQNNLLKMQDQITFLKKSGIKINENYIAQYKEQLKTHFLKVNATFLDLIQYGILAFSIKSEPEF